MAYKKTDNLKQMSINITVKANKNNALKLYSNNLYQKPFL